MKRIMRVVAIVALFLATSVTASAQVKTQLNGTVALPMGAFGDNLSMGVGFSATGKYMLNDNMAVGGGFGWDVFLPKETDDEFTLTVIPVFGNFTYYFSDGDFRPYAGTDLGIYFEKFEIDGGAFGMSIKEQSAKFGFAPNVGMEYDLTETLIIDFNVKYNYINGGLEVGDMIILDNDGKGGAASFVGINIGVIYNIGD